MQSISIETIFLPIHIGLLLFIIWNIFHADKLGFSWIKGKISKLDAIKVKKLHNNVFYGLVGMLITGLALFWPLREKLSGSTAFKFKMGLVAILFINSLFISKFMKVASEKKYSDLSTKEKIPLIISGVVSTLAWIFTLVAVSFLPE